MYKHILVPTDGSALSLKAAKEAAKLAKNLKAKITALYVIEPYMPPSPGESALLTNQTEAQEQYAKAMKKHAGEALAKVEAAAAAAKVSCDKLSITDFQPWDGIIKAARSKKCDLIVMATHGRRGLASLILGSQTNKVLTHSKTPVLVCR
jgi:nucleotide-binding universal stress UspA family protein